MFRKSAFVALALGLTAIGSGTVLAKPSPTLGGAKGALPSKVPITSVQKVPSAALHPGSLKVVQAPLPLPGKTGGVASGPFGQKPTPLKVPLPGTQTPVPMGVKPPPQKPKPPGVDNICPFNKFKCPPSNGGYPSKPPGSGYPSQPSGNGPVVIWTPQAPIGVSGPVPVYGPVPVSGPVQVPVNTGVGATVAQSTPPISTGARSCGSAANIPPLGAGIDELLPTAQLSADDMAKVTMLRTEMQQLAANGKDGSARDIEEIAMHILGYNKLWLRCGFGTFTWVKQAANEVGQAQ